MRKAFKSIISIVLIISTLICATVPAFAVGGEEYICDIRIIYAEDYAEAKKILAASDFKDYKLLRENLNEDTGEIGVWLAYKTTTDIEDAITDISVMQMNGGYNIGNYQEMIEQSYEEYITMSDTYLQAIDYFVRAYDAGNFMAKLAYRQLNFYNVVSIGAPDEELHTFEGERIGDIFYNGVAGHELATLFMQGNIHALNNIRSLLAMGVSYNEDGSHYLEKVAEAAERMSANEDAFEDADNYYEYDELALLISGTILTFRNMFKELSTHEAELNYEDDDLTELETKYAEYKSFADRMRDVKYLDNKSFYDFCLEYDLDESDLTSLYPLVAALNEGQIAMTRVAHYYDVVRYSMSEYPEDVLDQMVAEQEVLYNDSPFNVYSGVDRSIYYGSFALTSEAYRANAYTEEGFLGYMFKDQTAWGVSSVLSAAGSVALGVWAIRRTLAAKKAGQDAATQFANDKASTIAAAKNTSYTTISATDNLVYNTKSDMLGSVASSYGSTYDEVARTLVNKYVEHADFWANQGFGLKLSSLNTPKALEAMSSTDLAMFKQMNTEYLAVYNVKQKAAQSALTDAQNMTNTATNAGAISGFTVALYIVGAVMLLYSAFSLGMTVYNYYHPDYEDIPVAMVDLINTVDGDRYIKYDVALDAETNDQGVYEPADLNAFAALRWNALYYTKSYEAGKPLLANEFSVSNRSNKPKTNYAPVHRFGEVVCYDLNKYNYEYDTNIYLSVKQSKNDKAAVAEVPEVVGSMLGTGFLLLTGGLGAAFGVGGTLAVQRISKKKRSRLPDDADLKN